MSNKWKEQVGERMGVGTLHDEEGNSVEVRYQYQISQWRWERGVLGGNLPDGQGSLEIEGQMSLGNVGLWGHDIFKKFRLHGEEGEVLSVSFTSTSFPDRPFKASVYAEK